MSRKMRIAKGSGISIDEVNRITKQFEQMRKMMRQMTSPKMAQAMAQMQRMRKF
jgi:signal recognition particle subunit SRP54